MSRRIALLTLAFAVLGAAVVRAAEPTDKIARLGFVGAESQLRGVTAFREHLHELGWIEGKNLLIEARWAEGQVERLPALVNEVIAQNVDVLFTYHTPAALAAKRATSTVPIVAAMMGDPLGTGLATSLRRPGGNLTGISLAMAEGFEGKWLDLLHETVPGLSTVAVIGNPASPWVKNARSELESAARTRGLALRFIEIRDVQGLDQAFAKAHRQAQAALVLGDPLTIHNWHRILALAAKHRLPSMYTNPEFAEFGGLMAYGVDSVWVFRRAAEYVDKILRGAKPGDLPIEQPMQFKLVVNVKTASTLGLAIPQSVLLRADELIR